MESWRIENIVIIICTTVLILGLYWMSDSWIAWWGLILLLGTNSRKDED